MTRSNAGQDDDKEEEIPASLCEDSGLPRPEAVRECGAANSPCPKWVVTQKWTKCQVSECVDKNKGNEQRALLSSEGFMCCN